MKIEGLAPDALTLSTGTLRLERATGAIELKFQALPYGFDAELDVALPLPQPEAAGLARDARGKVVRDPDANHPVPLSKERGPGCKQAIARMNRLRGIYTIAKGLEADPRVTFEAGKSDSAERWCEAIEQELRDAGFSAGEVSQMLQFVLELSGLDRWWLTSVVCHQFPRTFARGGWADVDGFTDTIPAMLSPGEFVVNARSARQHAALLEAINSGRMPPSAPGRYAPHRASGNVNVHITTPVDRHTIRSVVIPEIERARSRGRI